MNSDYHAGEYNRPEAKEKLFVFIIAITIVFLHIGMFTQKVLSDRNQLLQDYAETINNQ